MIVLVTLQSISKIFSGFSLHPFLIESLKAHPFVDFISPTTCPNHTFWNVLVVGRGRRTLLSLPLLDGTAITGILMLNKYCFINTLQILLR